MNVAEKELIAQSQPEFSETEALAPSLLEMVAGGDATVNCF